MVPSGTGSGGAKRRHGIGPRHPAARQGHPEHVTRLLTGSRKFRPAALPTNGGASALDLVGECDQYEAIPPLRSGPRLAHCASLRLRPGYLAEGEGTAKFWLCGGPRHVPHLPCGRCMPWARMPEDLGPRHSRAGVVAAVPSPLPWWLLSGSWIGSD